MFARQVKIGGGVGGDRAGAAEPGKKPPDAAEPGELGVGDQRLLGARRAVVVEVMLIGFQRGPGEGGGGVKILGVGPRKEPLERPVVGIDGTARVGAGGEMFEKRGGVGR